MITKASNVQEFFYRLRSDNHPRCRRRRGNWQLVEEGGPDLFAKRVGVHLGAIMMIMTMMVITMLVVMIMNIWWLRSV